MLWVFPLYFAQRELLFFIVRRAERPVASLEYFLLPSGCLSTVRFVYGALVCFLSCAGLDVRS